MSPVPKETVHPFIDIEKDYGKIVAYVVKNRDQYLGKTINAVGEYSTYENLVKTFTKGIFKKELLFLLIPKHLL